MKKSYGGYETFKLIFKDGTYKTYYCRKDELLDWISVRDYKNGVYVEIMNRGSDKVQHRPIKLEDLK